MGYLEEVCRYYAILAASLAVATLNPLGQPITVCTATTGIYWNSDESEESEGE
jgi:hypothetical protein